MTIHSTAIKTMRYSPLNLGRWIVWGLTALAFLIAPMIFKSGFALTLLTQMGTLIIFALSYNMLLGQTGMLSFGHSVYSGLGAYFAIHALNWVTAGKLHIPVALLPLVGGLAGAFFGIIFGYVTTKKAGTPFAMITLGIGEMVHAASLMFPNFFGGEGGISGDRVVGEPFLGITFGPAIEVYYLVAIWCLASMVAMFAFTQTPLGRIANAARDNPERVEFIGYNTQRVRWYVLILSSFFAGISGGLSAINFEIVSADNISALRSGAVLLAAYIGGAMFFFGPIIGAVIFILFAVALSEITKAWQLYLGLFFVLMVMFAPGGVAGLILMNLRVAAARKFARLRQPYVLVGIAGLALLVGVIMVIEMTYHLTLESSYGSVRKLFGVEVDTATPVPWLVAVALLATGWLAFRKTASRFMVAWDAIQQELAADESRKGT